MLRRLLLVLSALAIVPLGVAWFLSEQVLHPKRRTEDHSLEDFDLPAEPVVFPSRHGIRLAGWFIPPPQDAPTPAPGIVLSHGWARSRAELLPHANFLHRAGYACLLFDYRHRGLSEGESITMGVKERGDLQGAVDMIASRQEVDASRIGILGMSMGGVIAVLVGIQDERVRAIVAECPFATHDVIMGRTLRHYFKLPSFPVAPLARWIIERRLGEPITGVEPLYSVGAFGPRPLFIIGAERDALLGWEETQRLFDAAGEPKRFWLVEHSDHARCWQYAGEEYERRVLAFFAEALGTARQTSHHSVTR
jgi:dienelactone hydrolase